MKYLFWAILLVTSSICYGQNTLKEVQVSNLTGLNECAYQIYLTKIKKEVIHSDSIKLSPVVDVIAVNHLFVMGSFIKATIKKEGTILHDTLMYHLVVIKKIKNNKSNFCQNSDWIVESYMVNRMKIKSPVTPLAYFAEAYDLVDYAATGSNCAFVKQKGKWGLLTIRALFECL